VDLLRFALLCALHFVAQWAFIGTSPFFLPKVGEKPKGNPFAGAKAEEEGAAANPFTGKASK
jgi:hypothetical protein